jgi:hypothetical protein
LLKVDVDIIAIVIRSRGASASGVQGEDPSEGDHSGREGRSDVTVRASDHDLQFELRHCREDLPS